MVKWTAHALTQLRHVHDYIAEDSKLYAKRVIEAIVRKTQELNQFPYVGRKVAELNEESIRELGLYAYRIIYEIKTEEILILAVIHKRRDLKTDELLKK